MPILKNWNPLGYLSLPGKVLILESKKILSLFQNYFLLFIEICFIQPTLIKHWIYADARLSIEAKTVKPPLLTSEMPVLVGRHTYT